jgi:hypothetical protein
LLSAAFSPDGRRIVTVSTDGAAKVWGGVPFRTEDLPGPGSWQERYTCWKREQYQAWLKRAASAARPASQPTRAAFY